MSNNGSAINWMLQDKPINANGDQNVASNETHSVLTVSNIDFSKSGNYSCSLINSNGVEEKSDTIALYSYGKYILKFANKVFLIKCQCLFWKLDV